MADNETLRSFYSVVGDAMLDKATLWAKDQLLKTGLWSEGGALAGETPGCGFPFRWGQGLEGPGHSRRGVRWWLTLTGVGTVSLGRSETMMSG